MISRTNLAVFLLIVFNLILLGAVFGFVYVLLGVSVFANIGALLFIKHMFGNQHEILNDVEDVHKRVESFRRHLESLHELETYYGDETLQRLIMHARALNNDFVDFQERHSYAEAEEGDPGEENDEDADADDAEEEKEGKTSGV
mgnify:CR=1 FL=1